MAVELKPLRVMRMNEMRRNNDEHCDTAGTKITL